MTADTVWNAFVPGEVFSIQEQADGPLAGLTMSVKDLFDIAGHPTGAGNLASSAKPSRKNWLTAWWVKTCTTEHQ